MKRGNERSRGPLRDHRKEDKDREVAGQDCRLGTGDNEVEGISDRYGLKFPTWAASFQVVSKSLLGRKISFVRKTCFPHVHDLCSIPLPKLRRSYDVYSEVQCAHS